MQTGDNALRMPQGARRSIACDSDSNRWLTHVQCDVARSAERAPVSAGRDLPSIAALGRHGQRPVP
jgi:hypothetical protein